MLHHVHRTLEVSTSPTQYLLYREGVRTVVERQLTGLDEWTSSRAFSERFDDWNSVVEVAVVCHLVREQPTGTTDASFIDEAGLGQWIRERGTFGVRAVREELAISAHQLDENKLLQTLVRLMKPSERRRLKGRLGACMQLLDAAVIRRVADSALGQNLPEEDQNGFGTWMEGARRNLYGTERVFDGHGNALRDYMTILGIDYGIKVRCYCEGPTEAAALSHALYGTPGAEIVDLAGELLLRSGKGVKFIESLKRDYRAKVFSVVVVDGDNADVVRALKTAATGTDCFPMHYVAYPDFEMANFSINELIGIALDIECGADPSNERRQAIQSGMADERAAGASGRAFFTALKRHGACHVNKGAAWGEALAAFALARPSFPPGHAKAGKTRPFMDAVNIAKRAARAPFGASVQELMIDIATGQPVRRSQ